MKIDNILNRNFVTPPNKVWVSDITYIQTEQGWGLFMYYPRSFF